MNWKSECTIAAMLIGSILASGNFVVMAEELPRIVYHGSIGIWDTDNDIWDDSTFFFPQVRRMGATAGINGFDRSLFNTPTQLRDILTPDSSNVKLFAMMPPKTVPNDWNAQGDWPMNVQRAIYLQELEDEVWNEANDQNSDDKYDPDPDWFEFGMSNASASGNPPQYYYCNPATHNAGYVFAAFPHNDVLHYQGYYAFEIEVYREGADSSDTPMLRLEIEDPSVGSNPIAIDAELIIKSKDVARNSWTYMGLKFWNWDSTQAHPSRAWAFKAGGYTKISVYSYDNVTFRIRKLRIYDSNSYLLKYHANKQNYWYSLHVCFDQIVDDLRFIRYLNT